MLQGYKTYIVVAIAIISALLGYLNDQLTLFQAVQGIGLALGVGGNRALLRAAEVLTGPFSVAAASVSPEARAMITHVGAVLAIGAAALAGLEAQQDPALTIGTILGALGLNFLGLGTKRVADGKIA